MKKRNRKSAQRGKGTSIKAKRKSTRTSAQKQVKAMKANLQPAEVIPGEVLLGEGDIVAFEGRTTIELTVSNLGDRPIQVGSHCHFFEANRALRFERAKAFGFRLEIPAGTAVRFEPGEEKDVTLVQIGGHRAAYGINGLTNGRLDDPNVRTRAVALAKERGFIKS